MRSSFNIFSVEALNYLQCFTIIAGPGAQHLWRQFKQFHLTENMRLINSDDQEEKDFAQYLLKIGNGEVEASDEAPDSAEMVISLPEKFLSKAATARDLPNHAFISGGYAALALVMKVRVPSFASWGRAPL